MSELVRSTYRDMATENITLLNIVSEFRAQTVTTSTKRSVSANAG